MYFKEIQLVSTKIEELPAGTFQSFGLGEKFRRGALTVAECHKQVTVLSLC